MALHPPIENVPNRDNADNRSGIANGLQDELNGMSYPSLSTAYRQALSNTQTPGKVDGANRDQIGAGAAGKDGEPGKTTEPGKTIEPGKTAGQCAESPDYKEIIDTAAAMMFDPSPLGDVAKLEHKHDCEIVSQDDALKYAKQELDSLGDPYTKVLLPDEVSALKQKMDGHFGGVGVLVQLRPDPASKDDKGGGIEKLVGPITVNNVFPGSPADKAGLQSGDVITHINGRDLKDVKQIEALESMKGSIGSNVDLTIKRGDESFDRTLTRGQIQVPEMEDKDLGDGIAYIRLYDFDQLEEPKQMREALERHKDAKAFVIDLRNNPGGLLDNALSLSSMFVDSGTLISVKGRNPYSSPAQPIFDEQKVRLLPIVPLELDTAYSGNSWIPSALRLRLRESNLLGNRPVAILTNGGTASASEIFTAAVKADNPNSTVIGTDSFGKGVVQTLNFEMPGGSALKATTQRYYGPNGDWFGDGYKDRHGIHPDIVVENPQGTEFGSASDQQLNTARDHLRAKLKESRIA